MANKMIWLGGGALVLVAAAALTGWLLGQKGAAPEQSATRPVWQEGLAGFRQAQTQALAQGAPLLYLVERNPGHCRRCVQLREMLFDNPEMKQALAPFVRVALNPDAGDHSQDAIVTLPPVHNYPALFMQLQPQGAALPLKIVVEVSQIWVPRDTFMKGHYMPLSPASMTLAIEQTRRLLEAGPTH